MDATDRRSTVKCGAENKTTKIDIHGCQKGRLDILAGCCKTPLADKITTQFITTLKSIPEQTTTQFLFGAR